MASAQRKQRVPLPRPRPPHVPQLDRNDLDDLIAQLLKAPLTYSDQDNIPSQTLPPGGWIEEQLNNMMPGRVPDVEYPVQPRTYMES